MACQTPIGRWGNRVWPGEARHGAGASPEDGFAGLPGLGRRLCRGGIGFVWVYISYLPGWAGANGARVTREAYLVRGKEGIWEIRLQKAKLECKIQKGERAGAGGREAALGARWFLDE